MRWIFPLFLFFRSTSSTYSSCARLSRCPLPQRLNGRQLDLQRPRWVLFTDVDFFPKCSGFRILATSEYVRSSSPQCLRFFTRGFFQCFLASARYMTTLSFDGALIVYYYGTRMCDSGVIEGAVMRE